MDRSIEDRVGGLETLAVNEKTGNPAGEPGVKVTRSIAMAAVLSGKLHGESSNW